MEANMPSESVREGFSHFMYFTAKAWTHHTDFETYRIRFQKHPFDLDCLKKDQRIFFVTEESAPDLSAYGLCHAITSRVAGHGSDTIKRLRVILCPTPEIRKDTHNVFFEVETYSGIFIGGGFNDDYGYRGSGRAYKEKMDSVFDFLSITNGVEIEAVEIPLQKSRELINKIKERFEERYRERFGDD